MYQSNSGSLCRKFIINLCSAMMLSTLLYKGGAGLKRKFMHSLAHAKESSRLLNHKQFLAGIDAFIFDCDGVVWKGNKLIAGAMDTINTLRDMEKKIFFVTNNSTKSRKGCMDKFTSLGLKVYEKEIFSSSFAAAAYLEQNPMPQGKKVYVIGQHGICEELDLLGISHIGGPADADNRIDFVHHSKINQDKDVGAVIVGLDTSINYYKIQYAQLCINENEGCLFIATNLDAVAHLTDQQKWAGGGAMVGAIRGCTGRKPILVGKPSPLLIDYITGKHKIDRSRICMVGDRLDTDIVFGRDNGLQTVLTLSGVTTEDQVLSAENEIIPDFFVASIADLLQ